MDVVLCVAVRGARSEAAAAPAEGKEEEGDADGAVTILIDMGHSMNVLNASLSLQLGSWCMTIALRYVSSAAIRCLSHICSSKSLLPWSPDAKERKPEKVFFHPLARSLGGSGLGARLPAPPGSPVPAEEAGEAARFLSSRTNSE